MAELIDTTKLPVDKDGFRLYNQTIDFLITHAQNLKISLEEERTLDDLEIEYANKNIKHALARIQEATGIIGNGKQRFILETHPELVPCDVCGRRGLQLDSAYRCPDC